VWDVEKDVQLARVSTIQTRSVTPHLSPDGKVLAARGPYTGAAGPDGTNPGAALQLWAVSTGEPIATIPDAFTGYGATLAFSADGRTVATTCQGSGVVQLWDAATGRPGLKLLGRSQQGSAVAFSPDGKTLATLGQNGGIDRWALPDGKPLTPTALAAADLKTFGGNPQAEGLAFADDERVVAWGSAWALQVAVVWEAPNGKPLTPPDGHLGTIAGVQFTADGKGVITAGMDRRVLRWDVATGRPTVVGARLARGRSWNTHLAPGGVRAIEEGSVYDPATGEELFALPGSYAVPSADFRRAAGFHYAPEYKADSAWFDVWDLEGPRRLARLAAPAARLAGGAAAAFSPDNARLVTAVQLPQTAPEEWTPLIVTGWDAATGKKLGEFRESMPNSRRFLDNQTHVAAGDGARAVVASTDGKLWVADYEKGVRGETLAEVDRPGQRFVRPAFSPDGKTFAVGAPVGAGLEHGVRVYDWPGGKLRGTFAGHRGRVTALAFAPDGSALASASADGTVLVWDLAAVGKK
jgi:WD40 repeat protein